MGTTTFLFPEPFKAEAKLLVWENWREPLRGNAGGRGLSIYHLVAVALVVVFAALYLIFR
jgi:hypothetical protein